MSDINITITGTRAEKINAVHTISKARRIDQIDSELAGETNPGRIAQLEQLRQATVNETVNRYILELFKISALLEMKNFKLKSLEQKARNEIREALRQYLDQFGGLE